MPQHDLILDNGSGAAFRADANSALAALGSSMKGPNAPPVPLAGMVWVDDDTPSATIWTVKQYDGADWIELGRLDITANIYIPSEGVIAWVDVASAATVDLSAQASRSLRLTGTTTITSFGTAGSGVRKRLRVATGLTITHNGTSLICPGAANLLLRAGDILDVESLGSGNWVVTNIAWINIVSNIFNATTIATTSGTEFDFTGIPAWARRITVMLDNVSLSGSDDLLIQIGDAGGIETSNYTSGSASSSNSTSGYVVRLAGPGRAACGMAIIQNLTGNVWVSSHSVNVGSVADFFGGGRKELSGTLDRLRLTRSGSNTFDGGSVNVSWE
jgi:hypothetical protein